MARSSKTKLVLIVPKANMRQWHKQIGDRLTADGFSVTFEGRETEVKSIFLNAILALETKFFGRGTTPLLAPVADPEFANKDQSETLTLDLTGAPSATSNTLSLTLSAGNQLHALASALANGELPDITVKQDGKTIATAHPMTDDRVFTSRDIEDVLARAVTLAVTTTIRIANGANLPGLEISKQQHASDNFTLVYVTRALPKLLREIWRRKKYHYAHWRVGFRFNAHESILKTNTLSGDKWHVLPDDGTRFYADPFPFSHGSKHYIFVEDYPHATGKAIISVAEIRADGTATQPTPIIEENWHLSYPHVFTHNDEIWMLPEASAGRTLTLYRATQFPLKWERHKTLIDNCQLSDATLLDHNGKFWLFAADKDGAGSTSDVMVIYYADQLEGPWTPHPENPICIDRAKARPGGAFINHEGKLQLPVQDGTLEYGGGLGFLEITTLTQDKVALSGPEPIIAADAWPYPRIHTYNKFGALEVIDGIAEVAKH